MEVTSKACERFSELTYYPASDPTGAAAVIFPGGGYTHLAEHEGRGYAEFFTANGIDSFVLKYHVSPDHFPLPLIDARRAVSYVRQNAHRFGIDANRVFTVGSSAGGHLATLLSAYTDKLDSETDGADYIPNAQILCYSAISTSDEHILRCYRALLGDDQMHLLDKMSSELHVGGHTPPTFMWGTADDTVVDITKNSMKYAAALRSSGIPFEMHIFPAGGHGLGLAEDRPQVARWSQLALDWLRQLGMI